MIKFIARACVLATMAVPAFASPLAAKPVVEVAFVLDTTGSMGALIEGAKRKIWSIATSILECSPDAEIRMGLVAYRDIGDTYVTKTYDLTTDIQDVYGNLLALRAQGGGDWPESVNEALEVAVRKLAWKEGSDSTRILFLVGDAPPHMDYAQDTKYPEVMEMAKRRGVVVNAVQAGDARDTAKAWRSIAQMGGGEYIPIPQDGGKIVVIETPYDDEIIELQKRVNKTVVPYGSRADKSRVEVQSAQIAAAPAPSASDMASYMNKRARTASVAEAVTGGGDLVADVAAGRKSLDQVKDDELSDELKAMKQDERKKYLDQQLAERTSLNTNLAEVVKKRDLYIADARKAEPKSNDSFDRVVESTLRAQIQRP